MTDALEVRGGVYASRFVSAVQSVEMLAHTGTIRLRPPSQILRPPFRCPMRSSSALSGQNTHAAPRNGFLALYSVFNPKAVRSNLRSRAGVWPLHLEI